MKIYLFDSERLFLEGLKEMILRTFPHADIICFFKGSKLLKTMENTSPDLVIFDPELFFGAAIDLVNRFSDRSPKIRVLCLSHINDEKEIMHLFSAGISGYLMKDSSSEELLDAVRDVLSSNFYLNDISLRAMQNKSESDAGRKETAAIFTKREKQVIEMICQELTNAEIADKLCLSKRTIDNHRNRIINKIGARNTVGLVKFAFENELLSLEPK